MNLHKFTSARGGKTAVTPDAKGVNLPVQFAPWTALGTVTVEASDGPRIGKDSAEIIKDVQRDGYSMLPHKAA